MGTEVDGAHHALFFSDTAGLLAGVVPFLLDGLAEGAAVGAALPAPHLDPVRSALGRAAERVRLFDMAEIGRNPGRILAEVIYAVVGTRPDAPARIVGESVWAGRSDREYPACLHHEALVNLAVADRAITVLCPYDTRLPAAVLADVAMTHPCLRWDGTERPSAAYAPAAAISRAAVPLPDPPVVAVFAFDGPRLAAARRFVGAEAGCAGLDGDRVLDVVLATGELAANSLRHGGGRGTVRVWTEAEPDGPDLLVVEVADAGHLDDPLAGRRPATVHQLNGRGLLMVHHLADLVRTSTGPAGTTTRTYWRR